MVPLLRLLTLSIMNLGTNPESSAFLAPIDTSCGPKMYSWSSRGFEYGQLARQSGVSADTIRHYEKIGLLPKPVRTPAGYRVYRESVVDRVRLIQNALGFGFSLKQLEVFLGVRAAGGAPCKHVRAVGAQLLDAIEGRIAQLTASREAIRETLELWDRRLSATPEGQRAYLLEALPTAEGRPLVDRRPVVGRRSRP